MGFCYTRHADVFPDGGGTPPCDTRNLGITAVLLIEPEKLFDLPHVIHSNRISVIIAIFIISHPLYLKMKLLLRLVTN